MLTNRDLTNLGCAFIGIGAMLLAIRFDGEARKRDEEGRAAYDEWLANMREANKKIKTLQDEIDFKIMQVRYDDEGTPGELTP